MENKRDRGSKVVFLFLVILGISALTFSLSGYTQVNSDTSINAPQGPNVTVTVGTSTNISLDNATKTNVAYVNTTKSNITFVSDGNTNLTLDEYKSSRWTNVSSVNTTTAEIQVNRKNDDYKVNISNSSGSLSFGNITEGDSEVDFTHSGDALITIVGLTEHKRIKAVDDVDFGNVIDKNTTNSDGELVLSLPDETNKIYLQQQSLAVQKTKNFQTCGNASSQFTVPDDYATNLLKINVTGAGGGSGGSDGSGSGSGGSGGYVEAEYLASSGETIDIYVGCGGGGGSDETANDPGTGGKGYAVGGQGGFNDGEPSGGGGGGATAVENGNDLLIAVADAGGGGGGSSGDLLFGAQSGSGGGGARGGLGEVNDGNNGNDAEGSGYGGDGGEGSQSGSGFPGEDGAGEVNQSIATQFTNTTGGGASGGAGVSDGYGNAGQDGNASIWYTIKRNSPPEILNVRETSDIITPGVSTRQKVLVEDLNDLSNVTNVTIKLYREDQDPTQTPSNRSLYKITYNVSNNQISSSPSGRVALVDGLNTSLEQDTLTYDFTPDTGARPSFGSSNGTVNDYEWVMNASVSDGVFTTTEKNTTEMAVRVGVSVNESSISASGGPGETPKYSPNLLLKNDGNIKINISVSATNQTNATSSDKIPADRLYVDDDGTINESSETGDSQQQYSTTQNVWQVAVPWDAEIATYNFVSIPVGIDDKQYTGNVTYSAEADSAS